MDSGLVKPSLSIASVSRVRMLDNPQGAGLSVAIRMLVVERVLLPRGQFKYNAAFGYFRTASCLCQECTFVGRHAGRSAIPVSVGLAALVAFNIISALYIQHAVSQRWGHTCPQCNHRFRYRSWRQKSPSLTHLMCFQPVLCL